MSQTTVRNVPKDRVPIVVRIFERASATKVDVQENPDGTSDITATFPDQQDHAAFKAQTASARTKK
jgi:hypothetical protein